jgi:putative FmdB family regulatory protein
MPVYEYRCGQCEKQFDATQPVHFRPEDTVCPFCQAQQATRLLSAFSSKIVGTHKPGFAEMKAYDMLNGRMDKFSKLPPVLGKRAAPPPVSDVFSGSESSSDSGNDAPGT